MDFLTSLIEIIKTSEAILTWKILSVCLFVSNALLLLRYSEFFSAILSDMDKYIKLSCLIFSILFIYKIIADSFLCILDKRKNKIAEKQLQINLLNSILALSKSELAVLKYIFCRPTQHAWLSKDLLEAILLTHKGIIKIVQDKRGSPSGLNFSLYINSDDTLYTLSDQAKKVISEHLQEIKTKWRNARINRNLDNYQE